MICIHTYAVLINSILSFVIFTFTPIVSSITITSVPLPKDVEHFKRERKIAIEKGLQVREAQPLIIQADVMQEEMDTCNDLEYTAKSIPLLLHQGE
ncbi:hypothetical protein AC249_AIPGENE945 [Exaiptasia diaphana]|nr:hypothetical protein AC249_AIPGENE945 [Exaiptasia diaphana]